LQWHLAASAGAASIASTPNAATAPEERSNTNTFLNVFLLNRGK
jgi:hypothetical protein